MAGHKYAINPGSTILVTGANGYLASHVCDILIRLGYRVRGTVRSEKPWLNEYFDDKYGPGAFETTVVPSLSDRESWTSAVKGVSGIAHVASDVSFNPNPSEVIPDVVKATINALEAASQEPTVRRVVLTSSIVTAVNLDPSNLGATVDEDSWNKKGLDMAWDGEISTGPSVYAASKTQGEMEAWKWVMQNTPRFGFNSVLPGIMFGRILCPEIPGSTMRAVEGLLRGDDMDLGIHPPECFVDVEDTARLHVIALLSPRVEFQRIFAVAHPVTWTDVIKVLHELQPDNRLLPAAPQNEPRYLSEVVPSHKAQEMIWHFFKRSRWVTLKQSIAAGIDRR